MAIVQVEQKFFNLKQKNLQRFVEVPLSFGFRNYFYVSTTQLTARVENGYLLIVKALVSQGIYVELPPPVKFFPKGGRVLITIDAPSNAPSQLEGAIGVIPISYYSNSILPSALSLTLERDDIVNVPLS